MMTKKSQQDPAEPRGPTPQGPRERLVGLMLKFPPRLTCAYIAHISCVCMHTCAHTCPKPLGPWPMGPWAPGPLDPWAPGPW